MSSQSLHDAINRTVLHCMRCTGKEVQRLEGASMNSVFTFRVLEKHRTELCMSVAENDFAPRPNQVPRSSRLLVLTMLTSSSRSIYPYHKERQRSKTRFI
ncbi:hypothetical protein KC19_4G141900 [Ceratodon purpureus]|uniref:Uncharacterized protein n=1 Tax=Ceratodon purpureus TaxID=3225 RepID=A0A8T0I8I0_CERPU|nr:hypothetical protein KC19_4G141900 [Ceratodon purpureus]